MAIADVRRTDSVGNLVRLVDAEFKEMPGMRLTCAQACRLWSLSRKACEEVLEQLVDAGALEQDPAGRYGLPRRF